MSDYFEVFIPFDRSAGSFGARVNLSGTLEMVPYTTKNGSNLRAMLPTDSFSAWLLEFCPSWYGCWEQKNEARFGYAPKPEGMMFLFTEAKDAVLCKLRWHQ